MISSQEAAEWVMEHGQDNAPWLIIYQLQSSVACQCQRNTFHCSNGGRVEVYWGPHKTAIEVIRP